MTTERGFDKMKCDHTAEDDMKKIVIVASDVAMPGEKGLSRLHYLAELFTNNGFDVTLVTADFQHWEKRFRTPEAQARAQAASRCKPVFLHEDGYRKNLDLKRILSYRTLARNIGRYLDRNEFDLVYSLIPDNRVAAVAGRCAKKRGVPFVIDVEDLWPEAMRMVFDVPVLSDVAFSYFTLNAKKAYACADAAVGSSDEYRDEPLKYGARPKRSVTVYVGSELRRFDAGAAANANKPKKGENEFWVAYAGTLGASYDLETMIKAADLLYRRGLTDIKTLLLGSGPDEDRLRAAAEKTPADVRLPGYLPYEEMAAYLKASDVTVNSLVAKASQSIVSKIGDYLAAGVPMINTGLNAEFMEKVNADGFGINVPPGNAEALADAVQRLYEDRPLCESMGKKARAVAETQFDRETSYMKIVQLAKSLLNDEG